jgi:nucleoid-associated protein EbfC
MSQQEGGFGNIMKQAQKMQKDMMRIQEEMASKTIEASAGGGMVSVVVNGRQQVMSISIEKDIVNPEDVDMLQDLVLAAINEGLLKSQEMVKEEMLKITGGMNIPGLNL